jgi:ornithine carbamoyltransferase
MIDLYGRNFLKLLDFEQHEIEFLLKLAGDSKKVKVKRKKRNT